MLWSTRPPSAYGDGTFLIWADLARLAIGDGLEVLVQQQHLTILGR